MAISPHLCSLSATRTDLALPFSENFSRTASFQCWKPLSVRCSADSSSSSADVESDFDAKVFRKNLARSKNYNRKGFGHKEATLELMNREYTTIEEGKVIWKSRLRWLHHCHRRPEDVGGGSTAKFWNRDDCEKFFFSQIQKYNCTVFRTNMLPNPFNASDPRVVAVLDAASFSVLFNTSKVEKRDVFTGTYMPSTAFTGSYRVYPYLDPSEQKHQQINSFLFSLLSS